MPADVSHIINSTSPTRIRFNGIGNVPVILICIFTAFIHLTYMSRAQNSLSGVPSTQKPDDISLSPQPDLSSKEESELPDVVIFRRTKKTGSSSMLEQILKVTNSLGYVAYYDGTGRMRDLIYSSILHGKPNRVVLAEHNSVTRDNVPGKKAIIIDTVVDGYRQMTSHCRYVMKVKNCDDELIKCLKQCRKENFYRWAGRKREDFATYIDIPLSSKHPALSTTVIRRVFPNATLDVRHLNAAQSACPEDEKIRQVYNETYPELEKQIQKLQVRMLTLAGFPSRILADTSIEHVLDKAEEMEKKRYWREYGYKFGSHESTRRLSQEHRAIKYNQPQWVHKNGEILIEST